MTVQLREHIADVLERIRLDAGLFCFLDYDGTLAPIAPTPAEARPLPGTAEMLEHLARLPLTQVAVVSGRSIDDVQRFINVGGIYYVGIHGLEVQHPGGRREVSPSAATVIALIPEIRGRLEDAVGGRPGILLEDKGAAIACHYRLASRSDAQAARDATIALADSYRQRGAPLTFIDGHEVTEIRPLDADKGKAVNALLASIWPAPLALYAGDDRTDEDAFRRLPPSSITIRVAAVPVETAARYRVADPNEVQAFLAEVVKARA
jgi:trehalose-phosphatase